MVRAPWPVGTGMFLVRSVVSVHQIRAQLTATATAAAQIQPNTSSSMTPPKVRAA